MRVRGLQWWLPLLVAVLLALTTSQAWADSPEDEETTFDAVVNTQPQAPLPAIKGLATRVYLNNVKHDWQTWNNCGPTTTSMALSYYGVRIPQLTAAAALKPNPKDVNVSPDQIVAYIRNQGLGAQVRVNGNRDVLVALLNAGIPVIAEQWINDYGGMGHYRLATGYDLSKGTVTFDDSFYGPDRVWSMDEFEGHWSEFDTSRIYIPVYRRDQAALVASILGPDADDATMWVRAEAGARANLEVFGDEGRVWYALGEALLHQDRVAEAVSAFERGYAVGLPWRYYWYQFGHFEALAAAGRWQRLLELTDSVLETAPMHEEMYYYRGLALQNLGDTAGAREAYNAALANNGYMAQARAALQALR